MMPVTPVRLISTMRENLGRQVMVNCLSSLIAPLLVALFWPSMGWLGVLKTFLYSMVFSNIIGTLAWALMPKLFSRFCSRPGWSKWVLACGSLLVIAVVGCTIACLFLFAIGVTDRATFWTSFQISLKLSVVITLFCGLGGTAYESMRHQLEETTLELRTKELERERALKLATEARLASLESRVHPHFLFNTLNSVSSLIRDDPQRAERLIERMAALLRFSLDSSHMGYVSLDKEMRVVADYLEIEKTRFGDRLRYEISIPASFSAIELPPLTIQTLVENSVKFAVAPRREGGFVRVVGRLEGLHAHIEVSDDGPGFSIESILPGHGLDILQSRLLAVYGMEAAVAFQRNGGGMSVIVSVPQHSAVSE